MPFPLKTSRLLLRPFCDSDLEPFITYRNDPDVFKYQGWKTPFTRADGLEFLAKMKESTPGTPGEWFQLAVEISNETVVKKQALIGDVAFHITRSNHRMAYVGYTLAKSEWGKGYAFEAVSKLLGYLFTDLNLHRVVADCDTGNQSSIRLLERLGFRREAHFVESFWQDRDESWGSEYIYAILQREWVLR